MKKKDNAAVHAIDVYVGKRLRLARKRARLTQSALGQSVGLSFQQIQKHENGEVRIGAGRLKQLADALALPVTYFYDGLVADGPGPSHVGNRRIIDLDELSEVKSACVRMITDAADEDVLPIKAVLMRLSGAP